MGEEFFGRATGKLGYGNMRLPRVDGKLDYVTIHKMVDTFMEAGYSYVDTCYTYEASERTLGEALVKRYPRERFQINTKLSLLFANSRDEMQKQFDESRRRLGVDYLDFYFLHALNSRSVEKANELDAWGFLRRLKEDGLVRHIGFSLHDTPEAFEDILINHPEMELVLLQLNYLDWENPHVQSRRLYEVARKHGMPVSVMEPCKGGWLASEDSESGRFLKSKNPDVSVASWAFRFLAGLEGVHSILTGMGRLSEVEDNIKTFSDFKPLSEDELLLVGKAVEMINAVPSSPCTDCRYCLPHCPQKIRIPDALQTYNEYLIHKDLSSMQHLYFVMGLVFPQPNACTKCGECEKVCPQKIEVGAMMEMITKLMRPVGR